MFRSKALIMAALAGVAIMGVAAAPADAQDLVSGTWTGTIEPPDGMVVDVEYEVDGDTPAITMSAMGESIMLDDIEVTDEAIHFTFNIGVYVVCELPLRDDGGYEGECVGDDGDSGWLTMVPPDGEQ